jgi:hypothetical protein
MTADEKANLALLASITYPFLQGMWALYKHFLIEGPKDEEEKARQFRADQIAKEERWTNEFKAYIGEERRNEKAVLAYQDGLSIEKIGELMERAHRERTPNCASDVSQRVGQKAMDYVRERSGEIT